MNLIPRRALTRAAMIVAVLIATVAGVATVPASAAGCRTHWGSLVKSADHATTGHVTGVRTGRHSCYDRLVIDLDGDRAGYRVEYVKSLAADGSGDPVAVKGGAIIRIIALAPAFDNGSPTVDSKKVSATNVSGYRTFRDVEWAGSFEGQTTIGLGVRARLPFRVFVLDGPGDGSRLVIDVAHRW